MSLVNKIKCCTWNCTTINNRLQELDHFLNNFNLDVCCLNETRLSQERKLKCKGYIVYRNDRNSQGGGVAVIIRNNIKHYRIPNQTQFPDECVILNLITDAGDVTVAAIYNPPNKTIKVNEINALFNINNKVLILGDLNARHIAWNCPTINVNGKILLKYSNNNNITIEAPFEPTHYSSNPQHQPSVINITLLKNIIVTKPQSISQLSSNHNPVVFKLHSNFNINNKKMIYNYKEAKWDVFNEYIAEKIDSTAPLISNQVDLEQQTINFLKIIKKATNRAVPKISANINKNNFPLYITNLIKIKNKIRRKYQKNRSPRNLREYNTLQYLVNKRLYLWRNECWNQTLSKLSPEKGNLWKIKKCITKPHQNIPPLQSNNATIYKDADKTELLASHFENIHNNIHNTGSMSHKNRVSKTVKNFINGNNEGINQINICTIEEIIGHIKTLKNKKPPGMDGIPNIILKKLSNKALELFSHIINKILELNYFPEVFKLAKIIAKHKSGKAPDLPINYRPVCSVDSVK